MVFIPRERKPACEGGDGAPQAYGAEQKPRASVRGFYIDMFFEITKRFLDIIISITALVLLSPLFLLIALVIWLEDRGPVIYSHTRVGRGRKLFRFYKFRSMVKNADEILFSDPKLYERMRSGSHKLTNDPRVTRVGRFIRKYSIDEFPQFVNVLRGEMSFVGPRAYRPDELERCEEEDVDIREALEVILSVKPGITGLWQVSGRSKLSFKERIQIEKLYANSHSLLLDFYVILRTPMAVVQADGAV